MKLFSKTACAVAAFSLSSFVHAETRINPGTARWARAAEAGRADVMIYGDSIVNYGEGGWSGGLARAAKEGSVGLAGSGLQTASYDLPSVWANYTGARIWAGPALESAPSPVAPQTPSARHFVVPSNFAFVGTGFDPLGLDLTQPLDWHVVATGTSGDAQLQATRSRRSIAPYGSTVVQTTAAQSVQANNRAQDYVFHFNGESNPGDWSSFEFTPSSHDAAIYYAKLTHPNATGISVSGWGESGGTATTFRQDYYDHSRFTTDARNTMYHSLVAGNSGLLNVAIAFGVNDAYGSTPAAYREQIEGLIGDVRRDWAAAGLPADDLSFTLLSTYQVNRDQFNPMSFQRLDEYRAQLDLIAAGDPAISFIDMWEAGPTWQDAVANNYLADGVHPTNAGSLVYGNTLLAQMMPETGDADIDGDVDFDDLLTLAQHYGKANATWRDGDFDGIGGVTFDDLLKLAQHYDSSAVGRDFQTDFVLAQSLVPEPSLLAAAGALPLLLHRRARRDRAAGSRSK